MKAASLKEIKVALQNLAQEEIEELCMRLAKYRKENKELLTYLLFEAQDESSYVQLVKEEMADLFETVPKGANTYYIKKTLRKILRFINRQVKYSGLKQTEIELRIGFCLKMKAAKIPMPIGSVLHNLYQQQIKKINSLLAKMPEDLQSDYGSEMKLL
jgi:hypothetical protein